MLLVGKSWHDASIATEKETLTAGCSPDVRFLIEYLDRIFLEKMETRYLTDPDCCKYKVA